MPIEFDLSIAFDTVVPIRPGTGGRTPSLVVNVDGPPSPRLESALCIFLHFVAKAGGNGLATCFAA